MIQKRKNKHRSNRTNYAYPTSIIRRLLFFRVWGRPLRTNVWSDHRRLHHVVPLTPPRNSAMGCSALFCQTGNALDHLCASDQPDIQRTFALVVDTILTVTLMSLHGAIGRSRTYAS